MASTSPEVPIDNAGEKHQQSDHPVIHASPVEIEHAALAWLSRASRALGRASNPILASIEHQTMDELPDTSVTPSESGSGSEQGKSLYRDTHFKSEWVVSLDETLEFNLDEFLTRLYTMSEEHASHASKNILDHIRAVSEEHGQVVEAKGRGFFEVFCESLERLEIAFDEDGNHNLSLALHPDTAKLLKSPSPEQQSEIDQILQRKREEWNAKRRRRNFPKFSN